MQAPSQGMFVYRMQMRHRLWIQYWQRRFGFEEGKTGRGQLTGLDVQIKTPVCAGGGEAEAEEGLHLSAPGSPPPHLAAGAGRGSLRGLLAAPGVGVGGRRVGAAARGGKRVLSILLHRGRPVITSSSSGAEPNPQLGSERALSSSGFF